ncbi:unnamed protein product [Prorocentrum cordatum]|uniref:Uncharacterized protein n=1 Tax=Prorocentrum cordatum TaxID=2364126 RepID=A0ABN9WUV8_9DINO|nr:unnamed protein product [Polarella glacialis]
MIPCTPFQKNRTCRQASLRSHANWHCGTARHATAIARCGWSEGKEDDGEVEGESAAWLPKATVTSTAPYSCGANKNIHLRKKKRGGAESAVNTIVAAARWVLQAEAADSTGLRSGQDEKERTIIASPRPRQMMLTPWAATFRTFLATSRPVETVFAIPGLIWRDRRGPLWDAGGHHAHTGAP